MAYELAYDPNTDRRPKQARKSSYVRYTQNTPPTETRTPSFIRYDNNEDGSEYDDIIFNNMKDDFDIYERSIQNERENYDSDVSIN